MSDSSKFVPLGEIIKEFDLEILCQGPDYEKVPLRTVDVNRPGLPLSGFFEHFDANRIQICGNVEHAYITSMHDKDESAKIFDKLFRVAAIGCISDTFWFPSC